ncbi:MAG: hypothetical protein AAFV45_08860 [Pseudomonadota bacterium]
MSKLFNWRKAQLGRSLSAAIAVMTFALTVGLLGSPRAEAAPGALQAIKMQDALRQVGVVSETTEAAKAQQIGFKRYRKFRHFRPRIRFRRKYRRRHHYHRPYYKRRYYYNHRRHYYPRYSRRHHYYGFRY